MSQNSYMIRYKFIVALVIAVCLSGCTMMKSKENLKQAEYRYENIELQGNYQALLKCWDDKAKKLTIDWVNQTSTQVYQDIGIAEIYGGGAGGRYAALIELRKSGKNKTIMNAYGTGWLGGNYLPDWVAILRDCGG